MIAREAPMTEIEPAIMAAQARNQAITWRDMIRVQTSNGSSNNALVKSAEMYKNNGFRQQFQAKTTNKRP